MILFCKKYSAFFSGQKKQKQNPQLLLQVGLLVLLLAPAELFILSHYLHTLPTSVLNFAERKLSHSRNRTLQ